MTRVITEASTPSGRSRHRNRVKSWLPRTRSRSPGHSAKSSTKQSSRQASGWATSPRQMTVSPAPTRRLQFLSRCRFISSTLPNGRPEPSSTEGSDRCRSDQSQVRSGALATTGTSASVGRSTSSSTRTFSRTGSMVDSRLLRASKSTWVSLDAQRTEREIRSPRPVAVPADRTLGGVVRAHTARRYAGSTDSEFHGAGCG